MDVGSIQAQAGPMAQLLKPTARISSALLLISLIGWHKVAHFKQTAHLSSTLLLTRRHNCSSLVGMAVDLVDQATQTAQVSPALLLSGGCQL